MTTLKPDDRHSGVCPKSTSASTDRDAGEIRGRINDHSRFLPLGIAVHQRIRVRPQQHREADQLLHHIDDAIIIARRPHPPGLVKLVERSEEHTSELQSLMRISYAVFCLKKKKTKTHQSKHPTQNQH